VQELLLYCVCAWLQLVKQCLRWLQPLEEVSDARGEQGLLGGALEH
jgi:hypothetical protein